MDTPSVTTYRSTAGEAISHMKKIASEGSFEWLLLRHDEAAWDVYDGRAKLQHLCKEVSLEQIPESSLPVSVDLGALDLQAFSLLGDVTRICVAEGHAGASAASLSNFVTVCRDLLIDAPAADVPHFHMVEGTGWPCRVLGLYVDMRKCGMKTTDRWLDRYRRLASHKPLNYTHYLEALSRQLAGARIEDLRYITLTALESCAVSLEERLHLSYRALAADFRGAFARELVEENKDRFIPEYPGGPEDMPHAEIVSRAPEIVSLLRRLDKKLASQLQTGPVK